jgi:hypothetical protein
MELLTLRDFALSAAQLAKEPESSLRNQNHIRQVQGEAQA